MSGLKEVLPKFGLVYSDRGNLAEIMSKPKLIPIKVCVQSYAYGICAYSIPCLIFFTERQCKGA
jgi:hypothetical protein